MNDYLDSEDQCLACGAPLRWKLVLDSAKFLYCEKAVTLEQCIAQLAREREELLLFVRVTANYPNPDAEWAWNRKHTATAILSRISQTVENRGTNG